MKWTPLILWASFLVLAGCTKCGQQPTTDQPSGEDIPAIDQPAQPEGQTMNDSLPPSDMPGDELPPSEELPEGSPESTEE